MMPDVPATIARAAEASFSILNDVSPWVVISLVIAGLLHSVLTPEKFQRHLGNRKMSSLVKATLSGMLLPICSCGVIPLGLGMYYSGAYLGPTLAFMTATPIINPAAVLLAYGLLGPKIATIYLVSGFLIPFIIGLTANVIAGSEMHAPGADNQDTAPALDEPTDVRLHRKLLAGLEWGFQDLGAMTGKYIVFGIILAGVIIAVVPPQYIQHYLGDPGMISVLGIAILGAVMYVCAVGHIPLIAALVASGAAPGVAITFLMTGAATNLPELVSIYKLIGKRAVAIYVGMLTSLSIAVGFFTNWLLAPGFVPFFNLDEGRRIAGAANWLILAVPKPIQYVTSCVVVLLCLYALRPTLRKLIPVEGTDH
ncbi:efflux transporter SaoE [Syntrophorhabdus aromaticivorans]|uniref:efflux transporter SaoE n=1 Tax=Syntrophorhabdus aromaticivorans TaxID=328301 RepID=UPI0005666604|nr:efflux transporter SaoE [Syntrophorhabdus aromaticivorans]